MRRRQAEACGRLTHPSNSLFQQTIHYLLTLETGSTHRNKVAGKLLRVLEPLRRLSVFIWVYISTHKS